MTYVIYYLKIHFQKGELLYGEKISRQKARQADEAEVEAVYRYSIL